MTLDELRKPFDDVVGSLNLAEVDLTAMAEEYLVCTDVHRKNFLTSVLLCASWQALSSIYYNQSKTFLTVEECYDIFLEAFDYVINQHVWTDKQSKLYQDKDGFIKAMFICTKSRKSNYVVAQHRQKRLTNYNALSMDALNDSFQEGFFNRTYDDNYFSCESNINDVITSLFESKNYLSAFVLDAIINTNVFLQDDSNYLKVRKHLRHINNNFCVSFADKYKLNVEEVKHSLRYFQNLTNKKLDSHINRCLQMLKDDDIISNIFNEYVEGINNVT